MFIGLNEAAPATEAETVYLVAPATGDQVISGGR